VHQAQTIIQLLEQLADRPVEERQAVRRGYDLATALFAGRYRACGRPFVAHLVGTASALARHGAPIDVVLAGLLHAAYAQGVFPNWKRRRDLVRESIGPKAEALVHEYERFDWKRVPEQIGEADREVVWLRIANEVDECGDRSLRYVGEHKRAQVEQGIPQFVAAARHYDMPALADELEAVYAENEGDPIPELVSSHQRSFILTPPLRWIMNRRWKELRRGRRS